MSEFSGSCLKYEVDAEDIVRARTDTLVLTFRVHVPRELYGTAERLVSYFRREYGNGATTPLPLAPVFASLLTDMAADLVAAYEQDLSRLAAKVRPPRGRGEEGAPPPKLSLLSKMDRKLLTEFAGWLIQSHYHAQAGGRRRGELEQLAPEG